MTAGGATTLNEVSSTHTFHSSLPATSTWGYTRPMTTSTGGVYLGPTIEVSRGHPVDLTVNNKLSTFPTADAIDPKIHGVQPGDAKAQRTVVHLHGGHDHAIDDGNPDRTSPPGQSYTYHYISDQEATGLWYHDHALGITRFGVLNGLAGQYLIRDRYDTGRPGNPEGLPTGAAEIPLTLQDKAFTRDGSIDYPIGKPGVFTEKWIPEYFGDTAVVNGKAFPNATVKRGVYRFRMLNASNARFFDLSLHDDHATMYRIGQAGGLLNAPVPIKDLLISPGDRADVLIDFSKDEPGTKITMHNSAAAPYPGGPTLAKTGGTALPDIMQFTVGSGTATTTAIPATLRGGPGQPAVIPAPPTPMNIRNVYLNEILDSAGNSQQVLLNNLPWDSYLKGQIEKPKAGTVDQ